MKKLLLLLTINLLFAACEKEHYKTIEICKETNQRLIITTDKFQNVYDYKGCQEFTFETIEIEAIDAGVFYYQYNGKFESVEAVEGQKIRF